MSASFDLSKTTLLMLVLLTATCFGHAKSDDIDPSSVADLKVSVPDFTNSINSAIALVRKVIEVVSEFVEKFIFNSRVKIAVKDCLDLMEISLDQLTSTLIALEKKTVNSQEPNGTGNVNADLKAWLSGALINQGTCLDGFNSTNTIIKGAIAGSLNKITSLVHKILSEVGINASDRKPHHRPDFVPPANRFHADVVVAADGSGNYTTIAEAVEAAPNRSTTRYVIYVKKGVYKDEYVEIGGNKWNIEMIGDGMDETIVTGNRNVVDGWTTFRSATFAVKGQGFIASHMTFENTAGPEKHQAVAFRSDSDLSVLYRCAFLGYQDTLYTHSMRQLYKDCLVAGTVDFIFGDASAVFQGCSIVARSGLPNQKNVVTAQGRTEPVEVTGFSIQFCNISVEPRAINSSIENFLGRPWKAYSRTVIMQSYIGQGISPKGWLEWNGNQSLDTLYYAEYLNTGPGAGLENRVGWAGYHALNNTVDANNFTVSRFILGDTWLPTTGVNYTTGLTHA